MSFRGSVKVCRRRKKGPRIVVIGGGTGLSTLLKGLKRYTDNITAVVAVTDDGGSSGRIRTDMGMLPPGDIRDCLIALSDVEPLMKKLFDYRFVDRDDSVGHSFGNLFIAAMTNVTGSFAKGIEESSRIMAVSGRVLPVTLDDCVLCAELEDGTNVSGETNVNACTSRIKRLYLDAERCRAMPEVLHAIKKADVIVIGPGSLYTSVITNLIVPGIADAILSSKAFKVYVCNMMTEMNETLGYTLSDHIKAISDHVGTNLTEWVIANDGAISDKMWEKYSQEGANPVILDEDRVNLLGLKVRKCDLVDEADVVRHNPAKLARQILLLANELEVIYKK